MTDAKTSQSHSQESQKPAPAAQPPPVVPPVLPPVLRPVLPKEIGGAPGPEPTRYGDWQHKGRVTDF